MLNKGDLGIRFKSDCIECKFLFIWFFFSLREIKIENLFRDFLNVF